MVDPRPKMLVEDASSLRLVQMERLAQYSSRLGGETGEKVLTTAIDEGELARETFPKYQGNLKGTWAVLTSVGKRTIDPSGHYRGASNLRSSNVYKRIIPSVSLPRRFTVKCSPGSVTGATLPVTGRRDSGCIAWHRPGGIRAERDRDQRPGRLHC